jgi:hypothetical protein
MIEDVEIVERLRARVAAAGSQREFARGAGLHESDVSGVLRGRLAPTVAVCRAVGVETRRVVAAEPPSWPDGLPRLPLPIIEGAASS